MTCTYDLAGNPLTGADDGAVAGQGNLAYTDDDADG
jgi:hypothetical protein